jgi:cellulose synthase (UDP-forming)
LGGRSRPAIALVENPADPYGAILALVGREGADVKVAAQALALDQFNRSGAVAEIPDLTLPAPSEPNAAPRWIDPAEPIFFTSFAEKQDLHVAANSSLDLYVRTPADLDYGSTRRLPLTLRYFIRDLPENASANVTVMMNGVFIGGRDHSGKDAEQEGYYEDVFPVPVEAVYPNSTLQVFFRVEEKANEVARAYPRLEILSESELNLTGFRNFAAMPRLDLFANNGFPFTRRADLADTAVVLDAPDHAAALTTYFNLMGRFGANTGSSALRVSVAPAGEVRAAEQKDVLAIGKLGSPLFSPWASRMTVPLDRQDLSVTQDSAPTEWLRFLSWGGFGRERRELTRALRSTEKIGAVLQGVESNSGGRAVIAIALPTDEDALELGDTMRSPEHVAQVYGSVSFLTDGKPQSFRTSPVTFFVGAPSLRANLDFWLRRFLWALPVLAILLAYALAAVLRQRIDQAVLARMEATR